MLVGSALYDAHETGLARIAQAKTLQNVACCMVFGGVWVFAHISSTFVAPRLVQCVKCGCSWQLICKKNAPAQRNMSEVIFDGFSWIFDPSWSQSSQNGVPIAQLMFLYEARAYRNIISTIGTPFGPLSV